MFLLGLLSFVQILFLPGFLIIKIFRIKSDSSIQKFLYLFGLSLSFNYFLVSALVFLKIYFALTIFIIFFIEILIFIYFWVKGNFKFSFNKPVKEFYSNFLNYFRKLAGIHQYLFLLSCLLLLFFIALIFVNSSTTYYFFDTIRIKMWAQTWASNNFMVYSHYPQLTATNSSINYLFINNDTVDFFSKAIMPLFFIGILLIFLDLYFRTESIVFLIGFILYSYILLVFYGILFISDFNNDIPVSFFSFLSFYVILTRKKSAFDLQIVLLAAFFAVSAANTKLVGLYAVALSGIWILLYLYNNRNSISKEEIIKTVSILGVIYIFGLFWYLIFPLLMSQGVGASPYRPFDGLFDSFFYGMHLITVSFGRLFSIIIFISLIAGIFTKAKNLILFVIAPLFFIWAFWYSYDCRNLSLIIPFTVYAAGYGLVSLVKKLREKITFLKIQRSKSIRIEKLSNDKTIYSILFMILLITILVIINTRFIFNLWLDTAYFLRSFYFDFTTLVFTSELGYYRYVEYYVNTISLFVVLIIIIYAIRRLRIKLYQLMFLAVIAIIVANFIFSKNVIVQAQKNDEKLVEIHNLYFEMHSYLKDEPGIILTNSFLFNKLYLPEGSKVTYTTEIHLDQINDNIRYVLFEKNDVAKNTWSVSSPIKNYTTLINNNNYIFFSLP